MRRSVVRIMAHWNCGCQDEPAKSCPFRQAGSRNARNRVSGPTAAAGSVPAASGRFRPAVARSPLVVPHFARLAYRGRLAGFQSQQPHRGTPPATAAGGPSRRPPGCLPTLVASPVNRSQQSPLFRCVLRVHYSLCRYLAAHPSISNSIDSEFACCCGVAACWQFSTICRK
jgi:hypothetical protein